MSALSLSKETKLTTELVGEEFLTYAI